jgi:hypothetical protein
MTGTVSPIQPSIPDLRHKVDRILQSVGAAGCPGGKP